LTKRLAEIKQFFADLGIFCEEHDLEMFLIAYGEGESKDDQKCVQVFPEVVEIP